MSVKTKQTGTAEPIDPHQALADCGQRLYELKMRIGDGDPNVTAADLDTLASELRFHQTRADNAAEAQQRRQAEADTARVEELQAEMMALRDGSQADAMLATLKAALADYLAAIKADADGHSAVWDAISQIQSRGNAPAGTSAVSGSGDLSIGGATFKRPDAKHAIEQMIRESWASHFPRTSPPGSR